LRKYSTAAGGWIAQNNYSWGKPKQAPQGVNARFSSTKSIRLKRSKQLGCRISRYSSIKEFIEEHRNFDCSDCLFVPGAAVNVPARVYHAGSTISAACYMCLLTLGTPPCDGFETRHLCGNGHLSCVNPKHLPWGTRGDNVADQTRHRKVGENVQDRVNAIDW